MTEVPSRRVLLLTAGLGLGGLEHQLTSGLPVVCCESGGNRELVTDCVSGYVVPPGDAAALAHRLELLRVDAGIRERMGTAGEARLLCDFSLARMVDAYVGIYDDCVRSVHDCPAKTL